MFRLFLGLLLLSTATTQPNKSDAAPAKPDFDAELKRLRQEQVSDATGRGPLVEAYEQLIASAGKEPKAADAMTDLAALWEARLGPHVQPDPAEAMKWYRRAAAAVSDPSSPTWAKSRFYIVWRVEWTNPAEARKLLTEIADRTKGDSVTQAQVENSLIMVALRENKLNEAEEHARNVLGWNDSPVHTAPDEQGKQAIEAMMAGAAGTIIDAIRPAPLPADARVARIKRLMDDFPNVSAVQTEGEDALKQLQGAPTEAGTN